MELISNINGLNYKNNWKNHTTKIQLENKKVEKESETIQDEVYSAKTNSFKDKIIDLQENVKNTQEQINILQLAGSALENISSELNEITLLARDTIESLEDYSLPGEIKHRLENINQLEKLGSHLEELQQNEDGNYDRVVEEFKNITDITIKLSRIQGFDNKLNDNPTIENVLSEINQTLSSVSNTQNNMDKIKDDLVTSIKSLNVTLENMISSYSRIRNVELASETVNMTQGQILKEAVRSLSIQMKEADTSVNKLIS